MALRSRSMVPSTASRVLIRVERYSPDKTMSGILYNPYLNQSLPFADVIDFTNKLDAMFDQLSFPQASMEYRRFSRRKPGARAQENAQPNHKRVVEDLPKREQLGGQDSDTFIVHVQFRQNATWQGTIKWTGQNEEKRFRSTLEMLKIMDSALAETHPEDTEAE